MTPYVFHPAALAEWKDAFDYYAEIQPELPGHFEAAVLDYRQRISADPHRFRVRKFNVRRVNLAPQFNEWYIAYMLWREQVVILAIGHAKRRPFYFRRRIGEARKPF